jgi:hypothetical protein
MEDKHTHFLDALRRKHGNITAACEAVRVSRMAYYRWLENTEFAEAIEDLYESLLDNAESKLHELINGVTVERETGDNVFIYTKPPDFNAIKYYLSTKGKKRGYVEKIESENTNKNDNTIKIVIDYGESES